MLVLAMYANAMIAATAILTATRPTVKVHSKLATLTLKRSSESNDIVAGNMVSLVNAHVDGYIEDQC